MTEQALPFAAPSTVERREGGSLEEDAGGRAALRLPPLNLFRTFDAAARHGSFRLAADELCVTPSAVSQQIRQLEDLLETRLFRRLTRRVELTREGQTLGVTVKDVLAMLSASCDRLRDPAAPAVVCISVTPTLGMRWLVPRLKLFSEQNNQIKISLTASNDVIDFDRQDVDLGIRWGSGPFPGMRAERLARDVVFPVCSPEFFDVSQIHTPADLARIPLLQAVQNGVTWATWFDRAGAGAVEPAEEVIHYNDTIMMLEAIVCGHGIGLSSSLLAEKDLRSGRLVRLFDVRVEVEESYFILWSKTLGDKPAIIRVREWLQREALASTDIVANAVHR